jgi:hypothetical protein
LLSQGHDQTAAPPAVLYFGRGALSRVDQTFSLRTFPRKRESS